MAKLQLLVDESEMSQLGTNLANTLYAPCFIGFVGELGAGKTTLIRAIIQSVGYDGRVKSPTYGIVETYELDNMIVHHFDLYRVNSSKELDEIGFYEYFEDAICLIEWPEKGGDRVPLADLECQLGVVGDKRQITMHANTKKGVAIISELNANAFINTIKL